MDRYQRQILLKQWGEVNQNKIGKARVLIVGIGGLGCPALLYLAAVGVGHIGIVDHDVVELSNLHRQILFGNEDIGKPKVEAAAHKISSLNPDVILEIFNEGLQASNAIDIIGKYDIVVDATDLFATRYMINDACVLLGKPLVYGAVAAFEGQLALFNANGGVAHRSTNLRDIFPVIPHTSMVYNCAEDGVIGVLPGIIGTMQATEVLKWLTGIGQPLSNKLMTYDALTHENYIVSLSLNAQAYDAMPKDRIAFEKVHSMSIECNTTNIEAVYTHQLTALWNSEGMTVIDVREKGESPYPSGTHIQIPLSTIDHEGHFPKYQSVMFFCQSGVRSKKAASLYAAKYPDASTYYVKANIQEWISTITNKSDLHDNSKD